MVLVAFWINTGDMSNRLNGLTAIISGGARGQGAAEARRFIEEGAYVVIADVLAAEGRSLAAELGDNAEFKHLDVTDEENWALVVKDLVKSGRKLDVLVNNAGVLLFDRLTRTSREEFERIMDVNCTGVFLGMRAVVAEMKKQEGGSIINISSTAGRRGIPDYGAYCATKFAMVGFTQQLAIELAKENIKVDVNGSGVITLLINNVDSDTDEFAGTFEAIQPSDTDMGSKDPLDVKIIGELYGRKA